MHSESGCISIGKGAPLVFQHGLTANTGQVQGLLGGVEAIHLMSIDCPGHGNSKLAEDDIVSFDRYADMVIEFLDGQGVKRSVFGGISMGSGIALNIALRYPEKVMGLIIVRPAWLDYPNPGNLRVLLPAASLMNQSDGQRRFCQLQEFRDIEPPKAAESILGIFSPEQQPSLSSVIKQMVGDRPFGSMDQLKQISAPCLVLGNEDDPLHPFSMAEKIHQSIGGSLLKKLTSRYIDDNLHSEQVRKGIVEFLQETNLI